MLLIVLIGSNVSISKLIFVITIISMILIVFKISIKHLVSSINPNDFTLAIKFSIDKLTIINVLIRHNELAFTIIKAVKKLTIIDYTSFTGVIALSLSLSILKKALVHIIVKAS